MVIQISGGRVIATMHEVMVKLQENRATLQAQVDDISILAAAKMLVVSGGSINWSISLETDENVQALSDATGIAAKE
ncbi:DUF3389 family protein [Enterovibrio nigricans]|uniref:PTS sugar transporter subunit IIA n=1 Tax=Enterovibrio nigricans DSM 22720 TaxID=1121868 RepID=A0A1T4UI72_9GAMM|nr:DUF3389 family protein [Enterovibrio nigricans]PKF50426.1 DUF3389 domain-containing protein [Enterovibrio nigricans]SKA52367.1 Protein of unknown function [Enterovibrio nigricans DSM 22720]